MEKKNTIGFVMFFFTIWKKIYKLNKQNIYIIYNDYPRMSAGQSTSHLNCRPDGSCYRFTNHPHIILANVMFTDQSSAKAKHISY